MESDRSSGKCSALTLTNSEQEMELNWLVRSKKTAVWVGDWCACWGASMNFLVASYIALMTNDDPSGMPMV